MVMTTHVPEIHVRRLRVNVWLVAVVALAAALVALGAWVLVDRYAGTDPAAEATALVDDWNAAVNADYPADALAPLITSDFETWTTGGDLYTADEFLALATSPLGAERIAPVTVEGDFATTYVKVSALADPLIAVYQLKDGRIFRLWAFELGSTPPFDNAVLP